MSLQYFIASERNAKKSDLSFSLETLVSSNLSWDFNHFLKIDEQLLLDLCAIYTI